MLHAQDGSERLHRPDHESSEFRQLRHQTKNALQRIMIQVLEAPGLRESRDGRRLANDVARRIELAAQISDALFGFTASLEPLPVRLRSLAESVITLYADATQIIRLEMAVADVCPPGRPTGREDAILRIAHELVGNAVKHGMHMRLLGRITIRLAREAGMAVLSVANDGWRMEDPACFGEGLALVEELARAEGGTVRIRARPQTLIEVRLPCEGALPFRRDRAAAEIAP
jgi:two-component sensor histidine kinase